MEAAAWRRSWAKTSWSRPILAVSRSWLMRSSRLPIPCQPEPVRRVLPSKPLSSEDQFATDLFSELIEKVADPTSLGARLVLDGPRQWSKTVKVVGAPLAVVGEAPTQDGWPVRFPLRRRARTIGARGGVEWFARIAATRREGSARPSSPRRVRPLRWRPGRGRPCSRRRSTAARAIRPRRRGAQGFRTWSNGWNLSGAGSRVGTPART